ncbi:MAG: hydroxymethylbilane synthase [Verrucomicrobiota bacterium]|nr:hydroxymethylbilane synthase [Verrucomicrobiota bacterium]
MRKKKIRIGSRKSKLAVIQAEIVAGLLRRAHPELETEIVAMDTTGDIVLDQPLDAASGKGLFTLELEHALRRGEIDLSVHSLKDMPAVIPEDLPILAYSKREDPLDALVLPADVAYDGLGRLSGERPVGCSSSRRTLQLLALCPELSVAPIRGNVPTRIKKLDEGGYSALVLAAAGLKRLGLANRISRLFSEKEILPAAGQGILAVQGRKDFDADLLACIDDPDSRTAALAERAVIAGIGCGCSSPAAAFCRVLRNEVQIRALYIDLETGKMTSDIISGSREEIIKLAETLSARLLKEAEQHG